MVGQDGMGWILNFSHLLDTEQFYTEVQEIILARYNKTFDWSLKAKMMGKKAIESARVFVEETGISDSITAENFLVEREEMLQNMFPTSELMPDTMMEKLFCTRTKQIGDEEWGDSLFGSWQVLHLI
ncbi:unnamed protein product [Ilex paraguariensis]|uniref:Uncharacterized protein n=1 Tax=Ilex paraguariensis TaxID=185542 RepID=A0ABC8R5S5_9AQUA